jgi:hypothetical protein
MFARIHRQFGTAGLILSIVALVAALSGGAYAATAHSSKAGKPGPRGPRGFTGPAGPAGPQGPAGADGAKGANGTNGTNGAPGTAGKTVLSGTDTPAAPNGTIGDFYIETDVSKIYGPKDTVANQPVNGGWGPGTSLQGSPWTAGGTLPSTGTETGTFSVKDPTVGLNVGSTEYTAVSFNIPRDPAPAFVYVPNAASGAPGANAGAGCPGVTASGVAQAASGKFCVYAVGANPGITIPGVTVSTVNPLDTSGAQPAGMTPEGTVLKLTCPSSALGQCFGTATLTPGGC